MIKKKRNMKQNNLDLIFHIGYSKCASSTLQNSVFPKTNGYLGDKKGMMEMNYARLFKKISPSGLKFNGNMKRAKKIADDIFSLAQKDKKEMDRMILSHEGFIKDNLISTRPIIPFLKEFNNKVWHHGKIKVILIIRNQADRIASSYAQQSIIKKKFTAKF